MTGSHHASKPARSVDQYFFFISTKELPLSLSAKIDWQRFEPLQEQQGLIYCFDGIVSIALIALLVLLSLLI